MKTWPGWPASRSRGYAAGRRATLYATPGAVSQRLVRQATQVVVGSSKSLAGILERSSSVIVQDSSTLVLPDDLKEKYPGCGGSYGGGQAALKLQVEWDLRSGALTHVQIEPGKSPDGATTRQQARRGPGSLRIADLGYFSLDVFEEMDQAGEYFLSRCNRRPTCEHPTIARWI